jgi:hypothetical protein
MKQMTIEKLGLLAISLILVVGFPSFGLQSSSAATSTYNNVQVFLQTQSSGLSGPYTLTVYNSSGSLISSSQSNYPAFSLELPSETYLLTATAVNQSSPLLAKVQYWGYSATAEYGYQLVQISSSTTLNLKTIPLQDITSSKVLIQAKFVNGTSVSGAQLDASIVGLVYWWPFTNPYTSTNSLTLWNQTDSSGTATLVVPSVPVVVNAWDSVYVNLPNNETTVVKNIGGENVNVTVMWQPMYLGLSGSTLIIPPSNSGEITLHAQETPYYWYGGGVETMTGTATVQGGGSSITTATVGNSPSMIPSSSYNQQQQMVASGNAGIPPAGMSQSGASAGSLQPVQIPQVVQVNQAGASLTTTTDLVIDAAAIGALILAAASFSLVVLRRRIR